MRGNPVSNPKDVFLKQIALRLSARTFAAVNALHRVLYGFVRR